MAFAEDRARRWEPFGVTEADFAAVPERDGVRVVNVKLGGSDPGSLAARWLGAAAAVLGVLAAAAAAVSWQAQYAMVWGVKHLSWVAAVEAGIPDAGAVVFAALGVALALHGKQALRARALNAACIGISLTMNALAAGHGWKDLAIWVMPAAVYALASDTLIGVVRAWVLARQRDDGQTLAEDGPTPLAMAGSGVLWLLRLVLDPLGTLRGFRTWVVTDCPVAPGLRPGHVAQLRAVEQDADERIALAAGQRDQAVERAVAEARQARGEAGRARAAEAGLRAEVDRVRADASQVIAQALADAAGEREEVRAWSGRQIDGLQAQLEQAREDAARLVGQVRDDTAARIAALEAHHAQLRAERNRLAGQLRAAARQSQPDNARSGRAGQARGVRRAGPSKRDRMIELAGQRRNLAAVPLAEVSKLANSVAAEIGYSPGTARRELVRHVRVLQAVPAGSMPEGDGGQGR
jgi:hypothetical protein